MSASRSSVAASPTGAIPQISPTSRPTLSVSWTPTPTSSKCGWRSTSGMTIFPTNPVPQTTTLFGSLFGSVMGASCHHDRAASRRLRALEGLLQLAGDLVGRGIEVALDDLVGLLDGVADRLLDRRLADHDQPGLVGHELLGRLV